MEIISHSNTQIIKPENDLKEYQFVELPNTIQAFLISTKKHLEHFRANDNKINKNNIDNHTHNKKSSKEDPESPEWASDDDEEGEDDEIEEEEEENDDDIEIEEEAANAFISKAMELESENKGKEKKRGLASVSVTVCAGSCDEPDEYPGLAHLLEHIISLGSQEFPEEDSFSKFISRHGGFENAFTSLNSTTYEFDINNEHLLEALHRFSRLLKEPLLRGSGISKEIKAIDNEFELAAVDEDIQRFQVILSSFEKGFVLNKFPWGNGKSLHQKEEELQTQIKKFYTTYYKNEGIKVCIVANYSLEELTDIFTKCFGDLESKSQPNLNQTESNSTTKEKITQVRNDFPGCYFLKATSQIQKISFTWAIESLHHEHKAFPLDLIMNLLNERGPGSLYQFLKYENLITDLGAEVDDIDGQMNEYLYLPYLWMKLTDQGMEQINKVIEHTGEYLNMISLKKLPEHYYSETKTISQYEFQYADEVSEEDLTNIISQSMKYIPYQSLLQSGVYRVHLKEDKELLQQLLSDMSLKHARIDIQAPEIPAHLAKFKTNKMVEFEFEEVYFGTKYTALNLKYFIGNDIYQKIFEQGFSNDKFKFPEQNHLIPDVLQLHDVQNEFLVPTNIQNENLSKQITWHKMDTEFRIPKASVLFLILFNLKKDPITNLYLEILENYLLEIFFQDIGNQARKAGFACSIEKHEYCGLELSVYGFSGKIVTLSKILLDFFFNTLSNIQDDVLNQIIEKRIKYYEKALDDPEKYLKMTLVKFLYDFGLMAEEKMSILKESTLLANFKAFCKNLAKPDSIRKVKTYTHGNLVVEELNELTQKLHNYIEKGDMQILSGSENIEAVNSLFINESVSLATGLRRIENNLVGGQMISHVKKQKNNMVLYYMELKEDSMENRVLCQLLNQIFGTELFESLRMRQQIGYIANSYPLVLSGLRLGLEVWVSSSKLKSNQITEKIVEFINWFCDEFLEKYSEKEFEDLRQSEISIKTKPFQSIQDAANDFWAEIKYETLLTNRKQEEINYLNKLEFNSFKEWVKNIIRNSKRIALELESREDGTKDENGAQEEDQSEDEEEYEDDEEEEDEEENDSESDKDGKIVEEDDKFEELFSQNLAKIRACVENLKDIWNYQIG